MLVTDGQTVILEGSESIIESLVEGCRVKAEEVSSPGLSNPLHI